MADTSSCHSHQTSMSSENASTSPSQCDTPDNPLPIGGSAVHLSETSRIGGQPHSATMPDLSGRKGEATQTKSAELLGTHSPHPSPLPQTRHSSVYNYGSNPQLPQSGHGHITENTSICRSQPLLDVTPPPPPPPIAQQLGLDRRRSNSMSNLDSTTPNPGGSPASESVEALNAEPYLQPMEVQMVMHTLPRTHKLPESVSVHSIHGEVPPYTPRRQLPVQISTTEISENFRSSMVEAPRRRFTHRRTASNPWVLEGGGSFTENSLPPLPPPPVPARDYQRPSKSPPLLNQRTLDPNESSLDFPHDNRRSVASASLSPNWTGAVDRPQSHYADIDEVDRLSTVSGPFEEISDDPDSSTETGKTGGEKTPKPAATTSKTSLLKRKSSTLNSDYEKIEEYITMAPSSTFPRRPVASTEASPMRTSSGERTPKKSTGATPQKGKRGWTRQTTDSIIPDAVTIRSSSPPLFPMRRLTMHDNPHAASPASNVRPLPPSPSKSVTSPTKKPGVSKISSTGSNIYETIDEELLNRVHPRRRGSALPKWVPPVEPKHHAQYMVILRKFFTNPQVIEAWGRTVQEIVPGGDVTSYPPPYSSQDNNKQTRRLGAAVEVSEPGPSSSSTPKLIHQARHERAGSHDQYVIPVSLIQPTNQTQSSSTPATPAVPRSDGAAAKVAFSSPREQFASRRAPSRENLIEMLNMSAFQGDSSESESSDSEESEEEEEREEEEEEEEEESKEEEVEGEGSEEGEEVEEERDEGEMGGSGVRGEEGEGKGVKETGVQHLPSDSDKEEDERTVEQTAARDPQNTSVSQISPDNGYLATEDELDTILTNLNPILSAFDSILTDTPDTTPHETSDEKTDFQTHAPPLSNNHHDPVLRGSLSTDSDLDSGSSLVKPSALSSKQNPPSGGSRVMRWVSSFERQEEPEEGDGVVKEKGKRGPPPPVTKRKPTRKREVTTDGMSDSGISNCHSQTFEDGFNPLETS